MSISTTPTLAIGILAVASLTALSYEASAEPATPSSAPKVDMVAANVPPGAVKVDGFVTDWDGIEKKDIRALTRGEAEYDWTGPRDLSMLVQMQYDATHLYLAIEVRDNIVTQPKRKKSGDLVEVWFDGGPTAKSGSKGRLRMLKLLVGEMANDGPPEAVWGFPRALKGRPEGLLLDGSIRNTGYFFEVGIPLALVSDPAPGLEPLGITFIARDWDYDDPNEDLASVASSPFDGLKKRAPSTMAKFTLAGAESIKKGFFRLFPDTMGKTVMGEQFADIAGDSRREWVFLVDNHYLSISGVGVGDGQNYYYELEGRNGGTCTDIKVLDLTGDGKAEILVRYKLPSRHPSGVIHQEFVAIYHFALDRIKLVFFHEVGNDGAGWSIRNEVRLVPNRKTGQINVVVSSPKGQGVTKKSYADVDQDQIVDWERLLLPWEGTKTRLFEWDTHQFLKR